MYCLSHGMAASCRSRLGNHWCHIPSNDHGTFEGASKLDMITITGTAGNYNTYNGALYNKDKTKLLLCPQGRTTSSYFMMAATTTEIGAYAFYRCANLNAVSIPETVKTISPDAFYRAKAIPHKDSAADALSDFSSDCTEIPKAY